MHIDGEGAQILANGNICNAPLTELAIIPPRSMSHQLEILLLCRRIRIAGLRHLFYVLATSMQVPHSQCQMCY